MRGEVEFSRCCEAIGDVEMIARAFIYLRYRFFSLLNFAQLPTTNNNETSVNRNLINCQGIQGNEIPFERFLDLETKPRKNEFTLEKDSDCLLIPSSRKK